MIAIASMLVSLMLAADPMFPAPPRLATTAESLAAQKAVAAGTSGGPVDSARAAADEVLKKGLVVPDGPGDWIFYYANPENGNQLKPLSLTEHQDPATGKVFTDERTVAAYRMILHDQLNRESERVAWGYALTDDDKYAAAVRDALLKLADDYENYPRRRDRWGRHGIFAPLGGRRYTQSLSEATGIIPLCRAYDLTRTSKVWSDLQRRHVEQDFFRATADSLLRFNQDINNHQTWYNAGLMAIANVLGDGDLVNRVLAMPGGFYDQLNRSIDSDGMWYEGTIAYHFYALDAMRQIVAAAAPLGLKLDQTPRYQAMLTGPPKLTYPNGQFPAINDSDKVSLAEYAGYYGGLPPKPPIESMNLTGTGLAILRRGGACAMIDYGPHGGGHGHFDKLQLLLFANGREWLLDPGRLSYRHKQYETWVKHTAAHNTVAIDQRSQLPTEGRCLWFKTTKEYAACVVECDDAYPRVDMRRYLLMTDRMLIERFDVESRFDATIDWFAHVQAESLDIEGEHAGALGEADGYPYLTSVAAVKGDRYTFSAGEKKFVVIVPTVGEEGEARYRADAIGYTLEQRVPTLIRRRRGKTASFLTVYDFSGDGNYVKGLERDGVRTSDGLVRYRFDAEGVTWQPPSPPTEVASTVPATQPTTQPTTAPATRPAASPATAPANQPQPTTQPTTAPAATTRPAGPA